MHGQRVEPGRGAAAYRLALQDKEPDDEGPPALEDAPPGDGEDSDSDGIVAPVPKPAPKPKPKPAGGH